MRLLCIVFIVLCVSIGQAQSINLPSGSTAKATISLPDSIRLKTQGVTEFLVSPVFLHMADSIKATVICPPGGWTKAQVDSAARWGLNQPIDTCYYKNQLGQVFKYGRLP